MGKKNRKRVSKRKGNHVKLNIKFNYKKIIAGLTGVLQAVYWLLYKELNNK